MEVPTDLTNAFFGGVAFSPKAPQKVWVASQRPNAIITSTDLGKTWNSHEGDLKGCLPSRVEAADLYTAWVSCSSDGNQPFVLKTENGGRTWTRQNTGPPLERESIILQGLCVVSPEIVWATGGYNSGTRGLVFRTVDGGDTWESRIRPEGGEDQLPADLPFLEVAATSADEAWIVTAHTSDNTQGSSVYHTIDGGSTWTLQAKDLVASGNDLNDIRIVEDVLWIAGDWGTVFRSVDGGVTWERFNTGSSGYNLGIAALDGAAAWAVSSGDGGEGDIVHTGDRGKTWNKQSYPAKSTYQLLADVAFEKEASIFADQ